MGISSVKTPEEARDLVVGSACDVLDSFGLLQDDTLAAIIQDPEAGDFLQSVDELDDSIATLALASRGVFVK